MSIVSSNHRRVLVGALAIASLLTAASVGAQAQQPPAAAAAGAATGTGSSAAPRSHGSSTDLRQAVHAAARSRAPARAGARAAVPSRAAATGTASARSATRAATPPKRAATRSTGSGTRTSNASRRSTALLRESEGNLGELFGVTRQVAGDAATVLSAIGVDHAIRDADGRRGACRVLAACWRPRERCRRSSSSSGCGTRSLREMTDGGKVVKFRAPVAPLDDENDAGETRARPRSRRTSCASVRSP